MGIEIDKLQDIKNGITFYQKSGGNTIDGPIVTGGPSSPVGLDFPVDTLYLQNSGSGVEVWKKHNTGVNDWRILSAQDVPFNPTGYLNFLPVDTDVDKALARLGNQSIADIAEIEGSTSNSFETTTSNGWVSKSLFPWTSGIKTAGVFSLRWFMEVGQTKATRNFGFRVRWRPVGGTWTDLSEIPLITVAKDNNRLMQSGFKAIELLADGAIEMDVQHGQTVDGFSSIMTNVTVELRRLGELPV